MQPTIIKRSCPKIDLSILRRSLHIKPDTGLPNELEVLLQEAQAIAAPKALYKVTYIESRSDHGVVLDGIPFNSSLLKENLDSVYRVFPYVATAGLELFEWANSHTDLLEKFWADSIQEQYLHFIRREMHAELLEQFQVNRISSMNPGSLADFPLSEQPSLFKLLGDPAKEIGVSLTDSFLMVPIKSVSGIFFASEVDFTSCMLCPRQKCQGRQSPFDPELFAKRFP